MIYNPERCIVSDLSGYLRGGGGKRYPEEFFETFCDLSWRETLEIPDTSREIYERELPNEAGRQLLFNGRKGFLSACVWLVRTRRKSFHFHGGCRNDKPSAITSGYSYFGTSNVSIELHRLGK